MKDLASCNDESQRFCPVDKPHCSLKKSKCQLLGGPAARSYVSIRVTKMSPGALDEFSESDPAGEARRAGPNLSRGLGVSLGCSAHLMDGTEGRRDRQNVTFELKQNDLTSSRQGVMLYPIKLVGYSYAETWEKS